MALRLAGEAASLEEAVSTIVYLPGTPGSGDLEPSTRSISATSRPPTPDYTASLVIPAPPDPRLVVLRSALRLQVTIDSFGGSPAASQLSYAVSVNETERLTGAFTATGSQYATTDLPQGQFQLGTPNQVAVHLWVNQGNATVSAVQLWLVIGSRATSASTSGPLLEVRHRGLLSLVAVVRSIGTSTPTLMFTHPSLQEFELARMSGQWNRLQVPCALADNHILAAFGTSSSDVHYVSHLLVCLRQLL